MKKFAIAFAYRFNTSYQDIIEIEFAIGKTEAEAFLVSNFYRDLEESYNWDFEDKPPLPVDFPELLDFLIEYYSVHITIKEIT